jgi:aryl-phospho-beta-D-glucosidase BglC (GH1 family)
MRMKKQVFRIAALSALLLAGCGGGGGGGGGSSANTDPGPGPSSPPPATDSPSVAAVAAANADFSAPANPRMNQRAYYRVTGTNLPSTLTLAVADCARMTPVSATSTELRFHCMPSFSEGAKAVTVKDAAGATTLHSSSITVQPATDPLPMPTYGFNLGNTFEATWGYPDPTQAVFTNAAKAGFNAVRMPCAWNFNSVEGPGGVKTGQIKAAYMAKVKQSVDWALAAGLHVKINIHWDDGWFENNIGDTVDPAIDARLKYIWTQIATEFASYDNRVLFAAANEPNADSPAKTRTLFAYYKTFIDAVRATGGNNAKRWLVLQGPHPAWIASLPADPTPGRLMMEYHNYTPSLFTIIHSDQSWGKAIHYWGKAYHYAGDPSRNATSWEEGYIDSEMQHLKEAFVDKGIPVLIGEMQAAPTPSLTGDAKTWNKASTLYWNKYVAESARGHGMSPFYWSTPNSPFQYSDGAILDEGVVKALTDGKVPPPPNGAPEAVTGLVAKAGGSSQVDLSWQPVAGATSYRVYRSNRSGYQPDEAAASNITGTSYSDTGLNAGTTYHYKVVAVNASGISGDSPEAHAATSGTNPDPAYFNFETDTGRWASSGQITGLATSTAQKYAGQRSLAVSIAANGAGSSSLEVSGVEVPAGGTITFRVWAPAGHAISGITPILQDYRWSWTQGTTVTPAEGAWSTVTLKVPANAVSPVNRLSLSINTSKAWTGTLHVDSVDWTP